MSVETVTLKYVNQPKQPGWKGSIVDTQGRRMMSAQIIDIATRRAPLRLVQPTLAQRLQMSLTPAPSDWPGKRVIVTASGMTGVVNFWDPDSRSLVVEYDNSELGLHDASDLTRIGSQPQGDGMPGDCA